ncbi:hypothetical protein Kalk_20685 [Ketobacter alkanivorans]|uniref:Uncharacterized protein n=1 Tax=Ketobacter alkanivorans TaxID=1917421 RepID=A0A2K9LR05_9GAMM|nr:hypothetical protein Kalk_20685 [Ketobacter alkanivorans]
MDDWVDYCRFILAIAIFILGCCLVYDLFSNGFDWSVFIGIFISFTLSHYLRPNLNRSNRPDAYDWLDVADFIIDFPYRFVVYSIRAVGKSKDIDPIDF